LPEAIRLVQQHKRASASLLQRRLRIGYSKASQLIDMLEQQLPALTQFILPGGSIAAAQLHLARTVCRRAERYVVTLAREEACNAVIGVYLNRLSDFLFVAARAANHLTGVTDVPWVSPRQQSKQGE
jgi:cob(I)alamin adenosyltransferase